MKATAVCQVCFEKIAVVDTDELTAPIRGWMFRSKDPAHGHPNPFHDEVEWQFMKCPYGNHRPFFVDYEVPIDSGVARKPDIINLKSKPVAIEEEVVEAPKPKVVVRRRRGRLGKRTPRELILEDE